MDLSRIDLDVLVPTLEARRMELKLSYQNVANSCNVSQATIMRVLKRQIDPSLVLLQNIVAAVKYDAPEAMPPEPVLAGHTQEDHIKFLQQTIEHERELKRLEQERHRSELAQKDAEYNRARNEYAHGKFWYRLIITIFVVALCAMFYYDFTHLDRGWIQQELARSRSSASIYDTLLSIRNWLTSL